MDEPPEVAQFLKALHKVVQLYSHQRCHNAFNSGIATLKKQYFLNKNIVHFMNFHRRYFQEFGIQNGKEGQTDNCFHQALLIHADLIIATIAITLYSYNNYYYLYHIHYEVLFSLC